MAGLYEGSMHPGNEDQGRSGGVVKNLLRQVPGLVWAVRRSRSFFSSLGALVRQLTFNEPAMRFAESFLRRYYDYHTYRLWSRSHAPELFDPRADLLRWAELRVPFWVERGVFSREVMFQGCRVLDLCCGDGFYPYYFYSGTASQIDAVDRDPTAIIHARKWHGHPTIRYVQQDLIADEFPDTDYDVITWDGAIEHFSLDEIRQVLQKCVKAMRTPYGVLNGYTIIPRDPGGQLDPRVRRQPVQHRRSRGTSAGQHLRCAGPAQHAVPGPGARLPVQLGRADQPHGLDGGSRY